VVSGLGAVLSLAILATAAAAQGGRASSPIVPPLVRVAAPRPMPPDVVTPVTEPTTTSKPKATAKPARPTSTTTSTTAPLPPPPALPAPPAIPQGKGMWIWEPPRTEGGSVVTTIAKAQALGLTHLYVRTGSSWNGFQNEQYLDQLVPLAHAVGIKVYGWDFPRLADARMDVFRAQQALNHVEPGNNRIDGFAADIETNSEGTQFTPNAVWIYSHYLRDAVGPSTLLIAVVPDPTPQMRQKYNYDATVGPFDAIAPMVYWLNREPGVDTADAMKFLKRYNKPLLPIGQAYDGGPEGGRPGVPSPGELNLFMAVAQKYNATAVSFWSWQAANARVWDTIKNGPPFLRPAQPPAGG
jgi:hypothetical protein